MGKRSFLKQSKFTKNSSNVRKSKELDILEQIGHIHSKKHRFWVLEKGVSVIGLSASEDRENIDRDLRDDMMFRDSNREIETTKEFLKKGGKIKKLEASEGRRRSKKKRKKKTEKKQYNELDLFNKQKELLAKKKAKLNGSKNG